MDSRTSLSQMGLGLFAKCGKPTECFSDPVEGDPGRLYRPASWWVAMNGAPHNDLQPILIIDHSFTK